MSINSNLVDVKITEWSRIRGFYTVVIVTRELGLPIEERLELLRMLGLDDVTTLEIERFERKQQPRLRLA